MTFNTRKPNIAINLDGTIAITFTADRSNLAGLEILPIERDLTVTVEEYHPKRTKTQNAYFWGIVGKIAEAIGESKDEVYKKYVREFGVYQILPIKNEAVESFTAKWSKNGMGWFCENIGDSKLDGYTKLIVYFGSSTYNTKEMARIIDAVIQDADALGIEHLTAEQWSLLKNDNGG